MVEARYIVMTLGMTVISVVMEKIVRQDFKHFQTSGLPYENNSFHDGTLAKLTEELNRLIAEAQKKTPDKRIGIVRTPFGLMICYVENYALSDDWKKNATRISVENVEKILNLRDPNKPG